MQYAVRPNPTAAMLEKDFVGQRSGTRKVCGSMVSQNQRKVRRSRSSIPAGAAALLLGGSAVVWQAAPRRKRSAANAADVRRITGLEVDFYTHLFATPEAHHVARHTERRWIGVRRAEEAQVPVVREVERIEHVQDDGHARSDESSEIFLQTKVDVAIAKAERFSARASGACFAWID